jgi:hypothetical protein
MGLVGLGQKGLVELLVELRLRVMVRLRVWLGSGSSLGFGLGWAEACGTGSRRTSAAKLMSLPAERVVGRVDGAQVGVALAVRARLAGSAELGGARVVAPQPRDFGEMVWARHLLQRAHAWHSVARAMRVI